MKYLPFDEAREFVHLLKLKTTKDWFNYCKSGNKPNNIYSNPNRDCKGWLGWGDWLGTGSGRISNNSRIYLPFDEAREFVHLLKLKTTKDWFNYCKSGNKPNNIPTSPNIIYKEFGWVSMGDWLGTGRIADQNKTFLPFDEAREFVHLLKLKNTKDWSNYCKSGNKPDNIPASPREVYKNTGWVSMGDWLGTGRIAEKDKIFLSFKKARIYTRTLNLKNIMEWRVYCKSGQKPDNIPVAPDQMYKQHWTSWQDFLGYKIGFVGYLPFEKAKKFVQNLNIKMSEKWISYCKSGQKPDNIPTAPWSVYEDKGWIDMYDWLGILVNGKNKINKSALISFIKSSLPELTNLDSFELINIISLNNLTSGLNKIGFLNDLTTSNPNSKERNAVLNNILSTLDNVSETIFDDVVSNNKTNDEIINTVEIKEQYEQSDLNELQTYNPIDIHYLDNVVLTKSFETDTLEFLMEYSLKKVWNSVLNDISTIDKLKNEIGGERFTIIKNWFFEEYNQVVNIQIPNDYIFTHQPNLMQKLIAYRLISRKRYGNWSGTGAGKTLSAILAGRIAGVKNTIIICNNATVKGWVETINESFKDNKIYTKTIIEGIDSNLYQAIGKSVVFNSTENNYFVLNYETFQQIDSENIIINLVNNNNIEYIVLDEVQMVKQRGDDESKRRNLINKIITNAELKNPDLLVLAMSATPITNNLTEPKKLIELLTSKSHDELNDVDNISNGIEMHKILTKHGLRYKPNYHIETVPHLIQIDGSHLASDILNIKKSKGSSATLEKILLDTKLDGIKQYIKKGTLLYTYYTTDIITKIGTYVSNLGFSVGYYTGEDKSGLEAFKKGKLDVLIGSSPVGTGVDGIQKVCNRIIPLILPWTAAEYQQLIGRVIRQGSKFKKVDIFIPQVVISKGDDEIWSWDKIRYDIIERKKTLSDLVIDGSIPTKVLPSHEKLVEDAKKELEIWIKKIEYSDEDLISPIRQELFTSMNPVLIEMKNQRNSELMEFNRKGKTTKSSTMHKEFKDNPDSWHRYHALRNDRISEWGEIPYEYIATKIKRTKDKIVDFGCGENKFKLCVPNNEVISFDHIAIDSSVIACDMKDVSNYLSDASVDVAVFSLALWGTNYKDYIKEAHRVLDYKGVIYIAEPISSYETKESEQNLIDLVENVGFELVGDIERRNKFIYIKGIKM